MRSGTETVRNTARAAVYARKSTEQNGVADEQKSVARQVDHARSFAAAKGWTVSDDHVYVDDGISGAEFANRPGYMRLLNALRPSAPFDILIVSELSRLGRELLETGYAVKQLAQAGVKIVSYLEDREIVIDTPTDKFLMSAVNFAAEIEREKARQRVSDAMLRKARAGHVCGGDVFGYRRRAVFAADGRRSHVEREIDDEQAAVVRRIFALCAAGKGVKAIAKVLNADDVPTPRPHPTRRRAWAPSSVRACLHQDLYRGVLIYNKTRQSDTWGRRRCSRPPEADWIRVDVPHLRIVDEQEWAAAHKRLAAAAALYVGSTNGQKWGRPPSAIESRYLLSGLGRCGMCGDASMTVRNSSHDRQHYFICANYDHRGRTVCSNAMRLPMQRAEEAILTKIRDYVLDPEIVEGAIADAVQELQASRDALAERRQRAEAQLQRLDETQARYVTAITKGGPIEAIVDAMKACERDRQRLQQELAGIASFDQRPVDVTALERDLRSRLAEWRELLKRQTPLTRQALMLLLEDRIVWTPRKDAGIYEFAGRVKFDNLISGTVVTRGMVAVRGFEPRFRG